MRATDLTLLVRASSRWQVALVALLVATSFGAFEVSGEHAYDDDDERGPGATVIAAASPDVPGEAEDAQREVPEERDDDEEERDDDERTEGLVTARAPSSSDALEQDRRGDALSARRGACAERGERGGHARSIDRPPHA